jgi:hypothetical protein
MKRPTLKALKAAIESALKSDDTAKRIINKEQPDVTVLKPTYADVKAMVDRLEFGDDTAYRVLYVAYWQTVTITSAIFGMIGQGEYVPEAQVERMARYLLAQTQRPA